MIILATCTLFHPVLPAEMADSSTGIYGTVTDNRTGSPIITSSVSIYTADTIQYVNGTVTDTNGNYAIDGMVPGNYLVRVSANGYGTREINVTVSKGLHLKLDIMLQKKSGTTPAPSDKAGMSITLIPAILVVILILVIVVILSSISYSKLLGDRLLDHETRRHVYDCIRATPGIHYRAILYELDLKTGVLTHHLRTLQRENFIKSVTDGLYKRFYPADAHVVLTPQLTGMQKNILETVIRNPGISQSGISTILGTNRMLVNYHIKRLKEKGLLRLEFNGGGKTSCCYAVQRDT